MITALLRIVGAACLVATFLAPVLYLSGRQELTTMKTVMLAATVGWFLSAGVLQRLGKPSDPVLSESP